MKVSASDGSPFHPLRSAVIRFGPSGSWLSSPYVLAGTRIVVCHRFRNGRENTNEGMEERQKSNLTSPASRVPKDRGLRPESLSLMKTSH
ncbi:hypothetical protein J6590_100539 [Homalodisca vitripennis]|nr:hypothetical protein J6590_011986 [Homalodisca vitripennis]KAG8260279.1 hypothetical protein J6590_100539 [Homalodisca vitripennis]